MTNMSLENDASTPIAIIGIGGRFPGDATDPEKLWDMISKGRHAMSELPKDRFNIDAFYHPHAERQGSMNVRGGHFLKDDIAVFDAPFFSITRKEADAMDPQQRMALEIAYEALENAGMRAEDVAGTSMACFMASFTRDYSSLRAHDAEDIPMYEATGNGSTLISNRISWFFDLNGPSLSLDTACSSSLVALHLACQSLRSGECESAMVGGTNLILMPEMQISMTALHFLSPDCKSQAFDEKANGYARGEGTAVVILKPLALALRDNDVIRAVIRGTAVNQDGKTPGITLPSAKAQKDLIELAYKNAGLEYNETNYFEAHGTGTPAGDPLECSAIGATFGKERPEDDPLLIGSIKTNLGHMEGASGLAGLIKAVYVLEKGLIPPNLWFEKANPRIPMDKWRIKVPTELIPWPTNGLRRVSVNSFGYGGTNAHCIVDDAYHYLKARGLTGKHTTATKLPATFLANGDNKEQLNGRHVNGDHINGDHINGDHINGDRVNGDHVNRDPINGDHSVLKKGDQAPDHPVKLFMWSSHEQIGLERSANSLLDYVRSQHEPDDNFLERLAFTLGERRSRLPWKSYVVASTSNELSTKLDKYSAKAVRSVQAPVLGFIFTGQGAQWSAMGRELLGFSLYRDSLQKAGDYLKSIGCKWNLLDELMKDADSSRINDPELSQSLCAALQIALVDLLASWGVQPSVVIGHSSGEIGAAYAKRAISQEDALRIAFHRGRLSKSLSSDGAMLAVGLGKEAVQPYLDRLQSGQVVVACINSPLNVTLSGDAAGISQVQALLESDKIFVRRLMVKTAYHSPQMRQLADAYLESLQNLIPTAQDDPNVVMFSSVTGSLVERTDLGNRQYWINNMVSPVKFSDAVQAALSYRPSRKRTLKNAQYINMLVEVGPHAALQGPLKQIVSAHEQGKVEIPYISILNRGNNASATALEAMGRLVQHGLAIDFAKVNRTNEHGSQSVPLTNMPPFAWNRSNRYWYESPMASSFRKRELPRHDLFGALDGHSSKLEPSWSNYLRVSEMPWMEHHRVQSSVLYPFAGMLVMAIEAARQIADQSKEIEGFHLRDVSAGAAIVVPVDEPLETKLQFRPWRNGSRLPDSFWHEFTISCRSRDGTWQQHCSGLVSVSYKHAAHEAFADEHLEKNRRYRDEYQNIVDAGLKSEDPRQLYASLAELGLQWGPTFSNLTHIGSGEFEAHCVLEIPDTKKYMPENFEYPHIIHPATLDTIIQMMVPALTPAGVPLDRAKIPRSVESAYISAKISTKPGDKIYGYSRSQPYGFNESMMTVVASNSEWNEPMVIMEGCRAVALETMTEGMASLAITKSLRKLGAHLKWDVDIEHLTLTEARKWFGRTSDAIPDSEWSIIRDLELASFTLCKRVLKRYSAKDAESFAPHLQQFYKFMQYQYQLATEGKLNTQTNELDWLNTTEEFDNELLDRVAAASLDGKLMCRQGAVLPEIFAGELEPLQVLREDDLLTEYYRGGIGTDKWNPIIHDLVQGMAHKKDLTILEVGAGTGGTTTVVLQALGGRDAASACLRSYTFTDISSGFFGPASEDFKEWDGFLEFKVLNIEKDYIKQGLPTAYYDLVVANNVLHATSSIDACLANCKAMLKPGGTLLLVELTGTMARVPLIFGTLSGLWNGVNDDRNWGPMLTEDGWNTRLQRQGFSGIDMVFRDHSTQDYSVSLMVARALPVPEESLPEKILLVEHSDPEKVNKPLTTALLESLKAKGVQVDSTPLANIKALDLSETSCIAMMESSQPFMPDLSEDNFNLVKHMILECKRTLWLTDGAAVDSEIPEANMMVGLGRTIRGENASIELTLLDLDPQGASDLACAEDAILRVLRSSARSKNTERPDWEYALRDGKIHVARLNPDKPMNELLEMTADQPLPESLPFGQADRPLALEVRTPGMLDTFQFVDDNEYLKPFQSNEVEISVKAVGMNFHDVMIAMGQIQDTDLGVECSGVVTRTGSAVTQYKPGDRVITFRLGCYRTLLRNPEEMFRPMPENMSFEDAATIPCVYTTVYYAIYDIARLQKGESILIHAAAGGLGQAAIILAQHIGAEIFVTVSSSGKKEYLMETYNIAADHIFNSRDLSFAQGIKRVTGGRGVDVVINSLAGEALRQTWLCVAPFGRFIEVGKRDIVGNTGLDMAPFMNNVTFSGVNMLSIYRTSTKLFARIIGDVMKLLADGIIWPVQPMKVMDYSQIEEAFRIMQTGKHMGKMVLKAGSENIVPILPRRSRPFNLNPEVTYLLPGGLGGLGRSIASWMVDHGARNLVFTSRSGDQQPRAKELVEGLVRRGVKVKAYACDISDREAFQAVLKEVEESFPPIRGVLTCAMQLQDSSFENMTIDDYRAAVRPKVQGTKNLHDMLTKDMDFFICLSSVGGVVGSRGQGNYNAGNTYQDALMHRRRALGLKGTSINVGVVLGIGITAERGEILTYLKSGAMIGVREQELLTIVQSAMSDQLPVQSSAGLATGGLLKQNGHDEPYWFDDGRFAHLRVFDTQTFSTAREDFTAELQAALAAAESVADAAELVTTALIRKLAKAMLMELEDLDANKPANAYGVDSLVAVEVRAWVFKDVKSDVSVFEILSNIPLTQLAAKIAGRSALVPAAVRGAEDA